MLTRQGFFSQFLKLVIPFWNSKKRFVIRRDVLLLVLLTVGQIYVAVLIARWNAALFDAMEQKSIDGLLRQFALLVGIFFVNIAITTSHLIVKRRITINWRTWITHKVVAKWLDDGRHYRMTLAPNADHANPDGRIAEDICIVAEDGIVLVHSFFYSILLLGSFTSMLWGLSGTIDLTFGETTLAISGYLVWIGVAYSVCASLLGWWMGKPLTTSTHTRQTQEANYRYALIKTQENSAEIALRQGESGEKKRLSQAFQNIIDTYHEQTRAWGYIQMFSTGYSVVSLGMPILVASPRYIAGSITLGTLMQSVQAFEQMVSALSWPANNMAQIAKWRASANRVLDMLNAIDAFEHKPTEHDAQPERVISCHDSIPALWPRAFGLVQRAVKGEKRIVRGNPCFRQGKLKEAISHSTSSKLFDESKIIAFILSGGLSESMPGLERSPIREKILSIERRQGSCLPYRGSLYSVDMRRGCR